VNKKAFWTVLGAVIVLIGFWPVKPSGRIGVEVNSFGPFWTIEFPGCRISTHGWMPEPVPDTYGFGYSSLLWRWDRWDVCDSDTGSVWEKSHFELAIGFLPESLKYASVDFAVGVRPDEGTRISFGAENGAGDTLFWWAYTFKIEGSALSS